MSAMSCYDCKTKKPDVRSRMCDEWLCNDCDEIRFPSKSTKSESGKKTTTNCPSKDNSSLSIEKGASAVLAANLASINKMDLTKLSKLNINSMMHTIRASMSSILPPNTDRAEIANHAMNICQKLKEHVSIRKEELNSRTQELNISDDILGLLTPLPASYPPPMSPKPTTPISLTASRIACVRDCQFEHLETRGKALGCSLCQENYHKLCVGLKPSQKPSIWICPVCKEIPQVVKTLKETVKDQEKEIRNLRQENITMTELIREQRESISNLQERQTCSHINNSVSAPDEDTTSSECSDLDEGMIATPESNDDGHGEAGSRKTLLIGDSIIRDINERGLTETTVKCIRGGNVSEIHESLKSSDLQKYSQFIIHGGTNDCTSEHKQEAAIANYEKLVDDLNRKAPGAKKVLSTICPRTDSAKHQKLVDRLNSKIRDLARNKSCGLVDNDNTFKRDNESVLDRKGLHLSKQGTRQLLRNMNDVCAIIKPRQQSAPATKRVAKPETTAKRSRVSRPRPAPCDSRRRPARYSRDGRRLNDSDRRHNVRNTQRFTRWNRRGCYFCGEQNHQQKDCRFGKPVECYACGELGHKQGLNLCRK